MTDIPGYKSRLEKAIHRYGFPPGMAHRRDIDYDAWDYLGYMQPSGAMYWQCYLHAAFEVAEIDTNPNLYMITIIDKNWHFGEQEWNFTPTKMEYRLRRALKGSNYIVAIEFEVFRNVDHLEGLPETDVAPHQNHGRLIAPHFQGFIWGKLPSRFQRAQFPGGLYNSSGIKVVRVKNFMGALRYMGKPPYRGRSVYQLTNGRYSRRPWPEMSLTLHHLLLGNLHRYCWPELTFGSGEGSAILAHAKRLWRDYVPGGIGPLDYCPPLLAGLVKRRH